MKRTGKKPPTRSFALLALILSQILANGMAMSTVTDEWSEGVDGELLVDSQEAGTVWARGIKGVFVGPNSKLRNKLVEAAWDGE